VGNILALVLLVFCGGDVSPYDANIAIRFLISNLAMIPSWLLSLWENTVEQYQEVRDTNNPYQFTIYARLLLRHDHF
jgi:hypothetical protein